MICKKSKGMMKQDFSDFEVNTNPYSGGSNGKHYDYWFHPFCAFTSTESVYLKDLTLLSGLKFKGTESDSTSQECTFCELKDPHLLLDKNGNKDKYFHSLCAYLQGCKISLTFKRDPGFSKVEDNDDAPNYERAIPSEILFNLDEFESD
jgi:hypothetical protein